jgi:hypothetical protein
MSPEHINFLRLVESEARKRRNFSNWLPDAMKVMHFIPDELTAEEAARVFIRWLFREPLEDHDGEFLASLG